MALALEELRAAAEPARAPAAARAPAPARGARESRMPWPGRGIPRGEVGFFLTQLSLVLETGSPLAPGLHLIADNTHHPRLRQKVRRLVEDLEGGQTLAWSLGQHADIFTPVEISMIRVGEAAGILPEMLERILGLRARSEKLRASIRAALTYPLVLMTVATGVVGFMMGFIFPRFERVFEDLGVDLPLSTKILLASSGFLRTKGWMLLPAAALLALAATRLMRSAWFRRRVEQVQFSLPAIGSLLHQIALQQLFLNLGSMLQARVPLLNALRVCRDVTPYAVYRDLADGLAECAERGESLAQGLARSSLVPGLARSLLATGEETGRPERVLMRLAQYYDEQAERRLKGLTALLEPALLLGMGGLVGFVVVSLILPIFRMSRGVH